MRENVHLVGHSHTHTHICIYNYPILVSVPYYAKQRFFNSRLVTKSWKLKLYRTVIRPIVTHASETWVLKETTIQKLLVF